MRRFFRGRKRYALFSVVAAVLLGGATAFAFYTAAGGGTANEQGGTATPLVVTQLNSPTLYDSTVSPLPGSFPSQPFQAQQTSEFGNAVHLTAAGDQLKTVTVTMVSWTCGNWTQSPGETPPSPPCTTTPGTSYTWPLTLTLYDVGATGAVGSQIATVTQTFAIPFRPSASASCPKSTGTQGWKDTSATAAAFGVSSDTKCHFGLAHNVTFNFSSQNVDMPATVIYGISYDTMTYGPVPAGHPTPATSLNVALNTGTGPKVGSDLYPGTAYVSTVTSSYYCTSGATVGTFSRTGTCWTVKGNHAAPWYFPAVQFVGVNTPSSDLYPGGSAQTIDYSVSNPGKATVRLHGVTISIASITNQHSSTGPACSPTWFKITGPPTMNVTLTPGQTADYSNASIQLLNKTANQDACQGATINLRITAN